MGKVFLYAFSMIGVSIIGQIAGQVAQTTTESAFDWVGIITKGGGFALAVYIVCFMYPKAAKEARDEREKRDAMWQALLSANQVRDDSRNALLALSIEKQTNELKIALSSLGDKVSTSCRSIPHAG